MVRLFLLLPVLIQTSLTRQDSIRPGEVHINTVILVKFTWLNEHKGLILVMVIPKSLFLWLIPITTAVVLSEYYSACYVLYTLALSVFLKYIGLKEVEHVWFSTRLEVRLIANLMEKRLNKQMITC
jgi:hypothetical protein